MKLFSIIAKYETQFSQKRFPDHLSISTCIILPFEDCTKAVMHWHRRHYPNMHMYMKPFNKENVMAGVAAVKTG
jgi:hypothetical protein